MSQIVQIPDTLDEAIYLLKKNLSDKLEDIKGKTEKEFCGSIHMFLGMGIRNNWNLWWYENHGVERWPKEKPKLVEWFNSIGIVHADDMSGIIVTSLYRNIQGIDLNLPEQIKKYHDHWKKNGYEDGIPKTI